MKFETEYVRATGIDPKEYKLVPLLEHPVVTVWEKTSLSQVKVARKFVATDSVLQYTPAFAEFLEPCVVLRRYYPLGNEVAYYSAKAAAANTIRRRVTELPNRDPALPLETAAATPEQLNLGIIGEEAFWQELIDEWVCWDNIDNREEKDKKPPGYWTSLDRALDDLDPFSDYNGDFDTELELGEEEDDE